MRNIKRLLKRIHTELELWAFSFNITFTKTRQ